MDSRVRVRWPQAVRGDCHAGAQSSWHAMCFTRVRLPHCQGASRPLARPMFDSTHSRAVEGRVAWLAPGSATFLPENSRT